MAPQRAELRVPAFGPARLELYGHGPLRFDVPRHGAAGGLPARLRSSALMAVGEQ